MERVTTAAMSAQVLANNQRTLKRLATFQLQLASGKRINAVSDDPVAARIALRYQPVGCDRQIIEHAITRAGIVQRMMAARRAVGGIPVFQCQLRGQPGAAIGVPHPVTDAVGYGKANAPFLVARDLGAENLIDVSRAMHCLQPCARHRIGGVFGDCRAGCAQFLHDEVIFVELERPARGLRGHVIGVVNDVEHGLHRQPAR